MEEFQSHILRNLLYNTADFEVTEEPPWKETLKKTVWAGSSN